jgi:hypothetical protein
MKQLSHGYVNTQIMKHLNLVGFNNFHQDLKSDYVTYTVDYLSPDGRHRVSTEFEIRGSTIKKDTEFHGTNLKTQESERLTIRRFSHSKNNPLLQDLFDIWYNNYLKWIQE